MAVIREEGSNGDREMVASLVMVGFQVVAPIIMVPKLIGSCTLASLRETTVSMLERSG